jgi:hypothetical protein
VKWRKTIACKTTKDLEKTFRFDFMATELEELINGKGAGTYKCIHQPKQLPKLFVSI